MTNDIARSVRRRTTTDARPLDCRPGCGACCIAQSISSPIPGMPNGKPAGVRCIQLSDGNLCLLYDDPRRPQVCIDFQAMPDVCGSSREEAMRLLAEMERETEPKADGRRTTDDGIPAD